MLHEIPTIDTITQLYDEASAGFKANGASISQLASAATAVVQITSFDAIQGLLLHLIILGYAIGKKEATIGLTRKEQS